MKKIMAVLLATIMVLGLSVTAFAADSPVADEYYNVVVINGVGAKSDTQKIKKGVDYTVKADSAKGTFNSWTVYKTDGTVAKEGTDYTVTSGSATSATFVIKPLNGVIVCGNYNSVTTNPLTGEANTSDSPKTGDFAVLYLSLIMLAALGCGFVAKKQLAK